VIKNLFVFMILLLSGCIFYVEPTSTNTTSSSTEIWVDYAQVDCEYDSYWGDFIWYFDAQISASYSYYDDEISVGVYIEGWDYYSLTPVGYGVWTSGLETYYYDCNDGSLFDFVVSDIYGNYDEVTVWW